MLDAFIIDRIRRQREERNSRRAPAHVEIPAPLQRDDQPDPTAPGTDDCDHGSVVIDDTL